MSKYTTLKPDYSIADGNKTFDPMQVKGRDSMIAVNITGLTTADSSLELEQSVDGNRYASVPGSEKILSAGQTNHQWVVNGLVPGCFLRVALKKGSATGGTITDIKILSSDE